MAKSEVEQTLDRIVTEAGVQRMALLRYLIQLGCQICGEPATSVEQGPRLQLEVARPKVRLDQLDDVRIRIAEQVKIRCAAHERSNADDVEAYLKRKAEAALEAARKMEQHMSEVDAGLR